jgi:hypothetical protein
MCQIKLLNLKCLSFNPIWGFYNFYSILYLHPFTVTDIHAIRNAIGFHIYESFFLFAVLFNICYVLVSFASILVGRRLIYRNIFMATYSFVSPFRKAKFCDLLSCVLEKLRCAGSVKKVVEHWYRRFHASLALVYRHRGNFSLTELTQLL